jgi:phage shock protein A
MDNDFVGKAVSGGALTAFGTLAGAIVTAWVTRRRDKGEAAERHSSKALDAIMNGNKQLMDSLLQTTKQLDEQLRATREELADTRQELAECESKHREADTRIAELERLLKPKRAAAVPPAPPASN